MGFTRPDNNKSVWRSKPDILQEQSSAVKADFDRLLNDNATDMLALIDELEATGAASGADSIGAPAGTVGGHIRSKTNPHDVTAAQLGAATKAELAVTGSSPGADLVGGPSGTVGGHIRSRDNPHEVTAAQLNAYTKSQTDSLINQRIIDIGAGDMARGVYDPTAKGTDVFAYTDGAVAELQGDVNTALSAVEEDIDDLDARVTAAQTDFTRAPAYATAEGAAGAWTATVEGWTEAATQQLILFIPPALALSEAQTTTLTINGANTQKVQVYRGSTSATDLTGAMQARGYFHLFWNGTAYLVIGVTPALQVATAALPKAGGAMTGYLGDGETTAQVKNILIAAAGYDTANAPNNTLIGIKG